MRRPVLLLASVALVVLLASGVALAATDTFSNTTRITIPDKGAATPYPSAVSVSGLGTVTDVDLRLNGFTHTCPSDVKVELVGPAGSYSIVMSSAGGCTDVSNLDLTLDDEATSTLPNPLSSGSFRPSSPLSTFDGTNPNGVWELYVEDMYGSDSGQFSAGWSLTITSEGPVEPPPTDTTSPETTVLQTPSPISADVNPSFAFRSSETASTFQCKLDGGTFQSCSAPKKYFLLSEGQHTFQVKATDSAGNTDQTPAEHTWTVDSLDPKVTFTQRPGYATGPSRWDEWVTNDRSPTWAWDVQDANPDLSSMRCDLYDDTNDRDIIDYELCSSPYTFEGELPDGDYEFEVETRDKAGNWGYAYNEIEVDTVAPKVNSDSVKPVGRRVSTSADVVVTFDDNVYDSKQFVNIYKGTSNTPLAVNRYGGDGGKKIEIDPKKALKSGTSYTVKVTTGVTDGANNLEAPYSWNFKTKG